MTEAVRPANAPVTEPVILVIDDKASMLGLLAKVLGRLGRVVTAGGVRAAIACIDEEAPDVVVCDLRMPDGDGLDVLRALTSRGLPSAFFLMTAYASVDTAVAAMREGARDYVTKPFEPDHLRALVERALAERPARALDPGEGPLLGASSRMVAARRQLARYAETDATVLVVGETGTGKELAARWLHERSPRADRPMVSINCAAIPQALIESELFGHARGAFTGATSPRAGIFEAASGSTLLLDEIGELALAEQAKLTRVLEERAVRRVGETHERPVDVRLVAATHRDLREAVRAGQFREDLWFRLAVCVVELPPLREREGDVRLLAEHFLRRIAPQVRSAAAGFDAEAMGALEAYPWPGNVRELRSAVERAAINETRATIGAGSLPREIAETALAAPGRVPLTQMTLAAALDVARDETSRRYLEAVLRQFDGNVPQAAAHAGVERESFYRLLRRHGLTATAFRRGP